MRQGPAAPPSCRTQIFGWQLTRSSNQRRAGCSTFLHCLLRRRRWHQEVRPAALTALLVVASSAFQVQRLSGGEWQQFCAASAGSGSASRRSRPGRTRRRISLVLASSGRPLLAWVTRRFPGIGRCCLSGGDHRTDVDGNAVLDLAAVLNGRLYPAAGTLHICTSLANACPASATRGTASTSWVNTDDFSGGDQLVQ